MALFGTGSAKMQISGSTTSSLLDYSIINPEFIVPDEKDYKSVITGHKSFMTLGDYSNFKVQVNLWKYSSPKIKFQELYSYLHNNVYFWPHADGKAISGSTNLPVEFHITDIKHSYLDNYTFNDVLNISFVSNDYTVVSKSLL
jgi:hypothetical protein